MSRSVWNEPHFHDEQAAYDYLEARVWGDGRNCPHCGVVERSGKLTGKSTRIGTYKCYACRKPFTVKIGTIFESSHVPLRLWLQAMFLMCGSKKGVSSNQLHRTLGVTLKTAWFMSHRIREAMKGDGETGPLGGADKIVEADETFYGPPTSEFVSGKGWRKKRAGAGMHRILTLVERGGRARSMRLKEFTSAEIEKVLLENAKTESHLMTDEAQPYKRVGRKFAEHDSVNHRKGEYARENINSNTVEGYFSIFKRGMRGIYQHCNARHLDRYLAEFDFRYNNRVKLGVDDQQRTLRALSGIVGKRLTYRTTSQRPRW